MPRQKHHRAFFFALGCAALVLIGSGLWWYGHPEPGPLTLSRAAFADLPGWAESDPRPALAAFQRSCQAFKSRPDSDPMGSYGGTLADWRAPCVASLCESDRFQMTSFRNCSAPKRASSRTLR